MLLKETANKLTEVKVQPGCCSIHLTMAGGLGGGSAGRATHTHGMSEQKVTRGAHLCSCQGCHSFKLLMFGVR